MNKLKHSALAAVPALLFAVHGASAQSATASAPDPDNTRVNKQIAPSDTANADNQKEDANDRDLTQRIRQSVIADRQLSTYAHNVKIVAVNGNVTLNGVVRSDQEREEVARKAQEVAGRDHVVNDLKVAPPK